MVMMVQANGTQENEDNKMEPTLRSEVPRTFSWFTASFTVM